MVDDMEPTTAAHDADPTRPTWRILLGLAGVLSFVGGGMHPQAPEGLTLKEDLAFMMDDPSWVPGHTIVTIGSALIVLGLVAARRVGALRPAAGILGFAIAAATAYTVEGISHTLAVAGKDELAAGGMPFVVWIHLALAVVIYPIFGAAVALVAAKLLPSWLVWQRPFAVLGIVGGVATALSAPLTVLLAEPAYAALFPVAGIGTAAWLVATALVGSRARAPQMVTAPA